MPKSLTKFISIFLVVIFYFLSFSGNFSLAFYQDNETSINNSLEAGTLDFYLEGGEWKPEEKAVNLLPGESVSSTISVIKDGGLNFVYSASTTIDTQNSNLDFCNALNLKVEYKTNTIYNGPLSQLNFSPILISEKQDDLIFTLTLSSNYNPPDEGANCIFTFGFKGWQENLSFGQGFFDEEELETEVQIGGSLTSGYSPIADSYVNEQRKNENYGNSSELQIRSDQNKNKRAFIKFNFNFPSGTTILSSNLKLYLKSAPSVSRIYEAWRVTQNWTEIGITWNNMPTVTSTLTTTTSSGTQKNVWLSFDVTNDVQSFVSGTPNYGWMLKDSQENSSSAFEAKFHSRESSKIELRPILEVQFSAPEITTDHLVINEVYYHVGTGKGREIDNEWVEIYNPTDFEIDVGGWKICDNTTCDILPNVSIPAKGFAVITNKSSTWDYWSIPSEAIKITLNSAIGNGLANTGDRVELRKSDNSLVDTMSYGNDTTYFELPFSGKGKSLARIIKGYDTNSATDWIINATPNPGKNPSEGGIETLVFTSYGVIINDELPILEEENFPEEEFFEIEEEIQEGKNEEMISNSIEKL